MTTYIVQIAVGKNFETNTKTSNRSEAMRRGQDLAAAGYDGRIVTAKGHVSQTWKLIER